MHEGGGGGGSDGDSTIKKVKGYGLDYVKGEKEVGCEELLVGEEVGNVGDVCMSWGMLLKLVWEGEVRVVVLEFKILGNETMGGWERKRNQLDRS